jgi:N-hydroxyarylamine O-acetyltransferase
MPDSFTSPQIDAYLQRIAYQGQRDPTLETLRALHLAHMLAIPFENLDIHWGRPICTDPVALFDKIVVQRRGGFCYELNGVFALLLQGLGYKVTLLSGQVTRADGSFGPEFDHLLLLVDLEDQWLTDVGFGDSFREPLRLSDPEPQILGYGSYMVKAGDLYWQLLQLKQDNWKALFRFTLSPRQLSYFQDICHFHQTSPESMFTKLKLCSLATPNGRTTLSERRLTVTQQGERQERVLQDEAEFATVLWDHFGIRIPH